MKALVTGSEGAIGKAVVQAFSKAGYDVLGLDLAGESGILGENYLSIDLDRFAEDPKYRAQVTDELRRLIGAGGLRAMVNNAGIQRLGQFTELTADDWHETFNVNVLAPAFLIQGLFAELAQARGSVVNISSIHANRTKAGFSAYAASKAALSGLSRALAVECGSAVRINAVQPAAIDTPMLREGLSNTRALDRLGSYHPVGRIGRPEEVAALCVYLCSAEAGFLNGAVVDLDGGIDGRLHDPA